MPTVGSCTRRASLKRRWSKGSSIPHSAGRGVRRCARLPWATVLLIPAFSAKGLVEALQVNGITGRMLTVSRRLMRRATLKHRQ